MIEFITEKDCKKFYTDDYFTDCAKDTILEVLDGYKFVSYIDIQYSFFEYGDTAIYPLRDLIDYHGAFYSKDLDEVIDYIVREEDKTVIKLPNGNWLVQNDRYIDLLNNF